MSFTVREALAGLNRTRTQSVVTIIVITASLSVLGLFLLLTVNFGEILSRARAEVEVEVILHDGLTDGRIAQLSEAIGDLPGVSGVVFVGKEEALRRFTVDFGEELTAELEGNPLWDALEVTMDESHRDAASLETVAIAISRMSGVDEVDYGREFVERLDKVVRISSVVVLGFGVVLLVASVLVVGNTIRLAIFSRRDAIEIMRLVGATESLVRRPFLLEGLLQSIVAIIASSAVIFVAFRLTIRLWPHAVFLPKTIAVAFAAYALLLGVLGSAVAVRRFLRT
jgi:cell division transport system permease protein